MDRFVSTFTNKIDAKGRVSVPAPFRAVLARDGYEGGIYCYPNVDHPSLDAGGESLARKIDTLLDDIADFSEERDEYSVALYSDVQILNIDGDGRIVLPEFLREHVGITTHVTFVGMGQKFQIWEAEQFEAHRERARAKVRAYKKSFGGGDRSRSSLSEIGKTGARE